MRKLFTFMCGLVLAVAANAKTDLKLSDNNNSWNCTLNEKTGECTYDGFGNLGWDFEDNPLAIGDIAYFVVKLKKPSECTLQLGAEGKAENEETMIYSEFHKFEPGLTLLALPIYSFETKIENVLQLWIKNYQEESAKIEIEEVCLVSEAEYEALLKQTTGIHSVKDASAKISNGKYYDLNGREVSKSYKGLAIVNGKKVIL